LENFHLRPSATSSKEEDTSPRQFMHCAIPREFWNHPALLLDSNLHILFQLQTLRINHIHPALHLFLDHTEVVLVFFRDESDGIARVFGAPSSTDSVNKVFGRSRQFVIHHVRQEVDVDPA